MAEARGESSSEEGTIEMQIMDCGPEEEEDGKFECDVPTQNRFCADNGGKSGRGETWKTVHRKKRKKVSSGSIDTNSFSALSENDKMACLYETVHKNFELLSDMKEKQRSFFKTTQQLQDDVSGLYRRTETIEHLADQQTRCLKMLTYRSIDSEARSRRNNVIIWGVTERSGMDVTNLAINFIQDELSIDTTDMVIDRAHRLGTSTNVNDPKRPIIIRFRDFQDTELIMKNAYKLKGTPFRVDRDYPKEIVAERKVLYMSNIAKDARQNRQKVQIKYPAKLFINGRLIEDRFPDWYESMNENRLACLDSLRKTKSPEPPEPTPPSARVPAPSTYNKENVMYVQETDADTECSSDESVFSQTEPKRVPSNRRAADDSSRAIKQTINKRASQSHDASRDRQAENTQPINNGVNQENLPNGRYPRRNTVKTTKNKSKIGSPAVLTPNTTKNNSIKTNKNHNTRVSEHPPRSCSAKNSNREIPQPTSSTAETIIENNIRL